MATLADLQARLAAYQAAELEILTGGQSYAVEGMQFSRADLKRVQDTIQQLENRIACFNISGRSALPYSTAVFGGGR